MRFPVAQAAGPSPRIDRDVAPLTSADQNTIDLRQSTELWYGRTQGSTLSDDPIGPGDVLELFVPATEKFKNCAGRVFDWGTIFLSFNKAVGVGGSGKTELSEEFRHRYAVIELSAYARSLCPMVFIGFLRRVSHRGWRFRARALL